MWIFTEIVVIYYKNIYGVKVIAEYMCAKMQILIECENLWLDLMHQSQKGIVNITIICEATRVANNIDFGIHAAHT